MRSACYKIGVDSLTRREREILRLLANTGCSNAEIAQVLSLSIATVENHLNHIYVKLDIRNRAEAVAFAFRHGLVGKNEGKLG